MHRTVPSVRWSSAALVALGLFTFGCSPSTPEAPSCSASADCTDGRSCIDGRCVSGGRDASVDGAPRTDGGDGGTGRDGSLPFEDTGTEEIDASTIDLDAYVPIPDGSTWTPSDDSDGDGISDLHEGRITASDTDADGTPDYLDLDSDGDGITDAIEAGDAVVATAPIDTDGDREPDFRDRDSDGNGVLDIGEGALDRDGDGRPDFRDTDNDGDAILDRIEIGPDASRPSDTNGDGTPDFNAVDSDADTIGDFEESLVDTDGDTLVDMIDLDADGDGWTDAVEAGDTNLDSPAVDTDGDGTADFRDPDSDGDGLSDEAERGYGTSRTSVDTDGDSVSDLIEVGAGTRPLDPTDSPRSRGDFVFLEPYMLPPSPTRDTLQFATTLQRADVYFLMDNTGSMGGTIAALQTGLTGTVIPDISTRIPEAWYGVGGFDDYPIAGSWGYGSPSCGGADTLGIPHDMAFFQYTTMTSSTAAAQTAVNRYRTNCGSDGPESGVAALFALASRDTLGGYARFPATTPPACAAGGRGAACFRADAVPIIVIMTDVDQHNSPTCSPAFWGPNACSYGGVSGGGPSYAATIASLTTLNARVVGIETNTYAHDFLVRLVGDTTIARGATGAAAEYVVSAPGGAGLTTAITTLVQRAAAVPLDVSARARDIADPGESVDAVASFLDHLETRPMAAPGLTCTTSGFAATIDRAGIDTDSFNDTFTRVTPGTPVCFDIVPKTNTTVMPTLVPQLFRAQIDVIGDGFTPLDDRIIYFLVPPRIPDPNE